MTFREFRFIRRSVQDGRHRPGDRVQESGLDGLPISSQVVTFLWKAIRPDVGGLFHLHRVIRIEISSFLDFNRVGLSRRMLAVPLVDLRLEPNVPEPGDVLTVRENDLAFIIRESTSSSVQVCLELVTFPEEVSRLIAEKASFWSCRICWRGRGIRDRLCRDRPDRCLLSHWGTFNNGGTDLRTRRAFGCVWSLHPLRLELLAALAVPNILADDSANRTVRLSLSPFVRHMSPDRARETREEQLHLRIGRHPDRRCLRPLQQRLEGEQMLGETARGFQLQRSYLPSESGDIHAPSDRTSEKSHESFEVLDRVVELPPLLSMIRLKTRQQESDGSVMATLCDRSLASNLVDEVFPVFALILWRLPIHCRHELHRHVLCSHWCARSGHTVTLVCVILRIPSSRRSSEYLTERVIVGVVLIEQVHTRKIRRIVKQIPENIRFVAVRVVPVRGVTSSA